MSILIIGMEMPKGEDFAIAVIYSDGTVINKRDNSTFQSVPVPTPHGDLIDRDDILKRLEMWLDHPSEYIRRRNNDMFTYLSDEEVVIESEE